MSSSFKIPKSPYSRLFCLLREKGLDNIASLTSLTVENRSFCFFGSSGLGSLAAARFLGSSGLGSLAAACFLGSSELGSLAVARFEWAGLASSRLLLGFEWAGLASSCLLGGGGAVA